MIGKIINMDSNKDIEKANEIINYHKDKLGLKGNYKLKIEDELAGKARPDSLSQFLPNFLQRFRHNITILFDRQFFKELKEGEFAAFILHELAHIKNRHSWITYGFMFILFFLLPTFLFGILFGTLSLIPGIPTTLYFIHRRLEYAADNFVKEYDNSRYRDDMISA